MTGGRMTFGDDGSPVADGAWSWLISQQWPDWSLDILRFGGSDGAGTTRVAPQRCGFARVRVLESSLDPQIALRAHQGTELVIVGATREPGPSSGASRSVVDALMRSSRVPLIVARPGEDVRRVLVFVHQSRTRRPFADALVALPWSARARVSVLSVRDLEHGPDPLVDSVADDLQARGVRTDRQLLRPGALVTNAGPQFAIFDAIDRMRPDLVVIGGPPRSWLARLLSSTVGRQVTAYAPCSVLVVPP